MVFIFFIIIVIKLKVHGLYDVIQIESAQLWGLGCHCNTHPFYMVQTHDLSFVRGDLIAVGTVQMQNFEQEVHSAV